MGSVGEVKNELKAKSKLRPIEKMVKDSVATLGQALPAHMNSERLVRIALTTLRLNPELYKCTPESFMGALFQSAQLGLEPNVEGQAYIIPFNNHRKVGGEWKTYKEAQFQIGYKGYVDLFYRHKSAVSLDMQKVYEYDDFDFSFGSEPFIKHKPIIFGQRKRGEVYAYYAVAKLNHGATVFKVMSKEECIDHGKSHSKCVDKKTGDFFKNTPWATNLDAMCMKTVLIQLMKLLPKSIELQRAISADETIKTEIKPDMLTVGDQTNWDSPEDAETQNVENSPDSDENRGNPDEDPEPSPDSPPSKALECECGAVITKKVHDFSKDKFGKPLCMKCQKEKS